MAESLAHFFLTNFTAHRNRNARAYGQHRGYRMEWFSYGQMSQMVANFCGELKSRGLAKDDRVMLWGANSAQWVAAFFGCAMQGVVVVPVDNAASDEFARRVGKQVSAKLWICSQNHLQQIAPGPALSMSLEGLGKRTDSNADRLLHAASLSRDDVLQIVFTSGTTAEPRGIVITHGNVLANMEPLESEMRRYLTYERWVHPVRFLNLLPLSHVFGQFLGMLLPPLLGGTVIFQEEFSPAEIIGTIRRERVSVLVSVPRVLQSLKQKFERDFQESGKLETFQRRLRDSGKKHFLHRWWIFRDIRRKFGWKFWALICGGAALDGETEEFWNRLGYAAIQGYGLTETTSLISVNHPFRLGKRSIGKVLPGRSVKLAEDGEIMVRGGGVASGYWSGDKVGRVADEDGWYHTGDIGAFDDAGNLYFKGRKKDVIVTAAGLNIYPEDLEAALRQQPEIKDCMVVGIERDGNAEPCAVLILRNGAELEGVMNRANQNLAEFQRMRLWMTWPDNDFPRTNTQKAKRNLITEEARKHFLYDDGARSVGGDELTDLIQKITHRKVLVVDTASAGNPDLTSDLGLSSLDRMELMSALEDRYQIDLSETRFGAARTLGDLEQMLRGEAQRAEYHYPAWVLSWPVTWVRWLALQFLMRPAMLLLGWPRVEGRQNLRSCSGPLLVVCNHVGDIDVGFVQMALPRRFRNRIAIATGGEALEALRTPVAGRSFFGKIYDRIQWILGVSLLNLFPLPREAGFRQSFAYAGRAIDRGFSVLVFPEGRHTVDGKLNPFRSGIGLLAKNLGVPVLPMRIHGLFELKQAGNKIALPRKILMRIGKPMTFASDSDAETIAKELQSAVEAL